MNKSQFSRLPEELLYILLFKMDYDNIQKLRSISDDIKNISESNNFWRAKFIHDYGFNPPIKGLTQTLEHIYLN